MDAPSFIASLGLSAFSVALLLLAALILSCFVKIVTVLGIVRIGLGFDGLPGAFVCGGLAIALSFFVMYPTLEHSTQAVDRVLRSTPAAADASTRALALSAGLEQWRTFLQKHADSQEVKRFSDVAVRIDGANATQTSVTGDSWRILVPAFLVSELREAFSTGLSLFLPFLIVDLVVAHLLLAIGIDRLSPMTVSLPFKLLLFVMVDGWGLITSNLVSTYG